MYPALMCLEREAFFLVVSGMEQWEAVKSGVVGAIFLYWSTVTGGNKDHPVDIMDAVST